MSRYGLFIMMVSVAFAATTVQAQNLSTLGGATGLFFSPTTDLAAADQSVVDLHFASFDDLDETVFPALHYTRGWDNFELGLGYLRVDNADSNSGFALHGKYRFRAETEDSPALAAGATFLDITDSGSGFRLYGAASKRLTAAEEGGQLIGYLNAGLETFEPEGGDSDSDLNVGLGLAYRQTTATRPWTIFLDFVLENNINENSQFAAGVRYPFTDALTGQAGFGDDGLFFVGARYNFTAGGY